jgi:hypothetical protein
MDIQQSRADNGPGGSWASLIAFQSMRRMRHSHLPRSGGTQDPAETTYLVPSLKSANPAVWARLTSCILVSTHTPCRRQTAGQADFCYKAVLPGKIIPLDGLVVSFWDITPTRLPEHPSPLLPFGTLLHESLNALHKQARTSDSRRGTPATRTRTGLLGVLKEW